MDTNTTKTILIIQDLALKDSRYHLLEKEYRQYNSQLLQLLQTLTCSQQETVFDYIGVYSAMHLRMLELAAQYFSDNKTP